MSGISLLTALEIKGNYPDNIHIDAIGDKDNMFSGVCYLLRNGEIHKVMLSSTYTFKNGDDAKQYIQEVVDSCVKMEIPKTLESFATPKPLERKPGCGKTTCQFNNSGRCTTEGCRERAIGTMRIGKW